MSYLFIVSFFAKYLGNQTSSKVKLRAIELMYAWKMSLRHLPKIKQAYDMLKEQGVVTQDPVYINDVWNYHKFIANWI